MLLRLPSGVGVSNIPLLLLGGWQLLQRRNRADYFVFGWIVAVFVPLMLTLPGPRYFFPAFPALAIVMARGILHVGEEKASLALFALLSWGGALYLFVDWDQAAGRLFLH